MSNQRSNTNHEEAGLDPELRHALRNFRASVHAWSDAAYHRPRSSAAVQRTAWRRAIAWVLSLVLSLGIVGTAAFERHHQNVIARQQEQKREQERQRQVAEQQAIVQQQARAERHADESEDLLARVDRDVSRQVPAAMEPLALLMSDDDIR